LIFLDLCKFHFFRHILLLAVFIGNQKWIVSAWLNCIESASKSVNIHGNSQTSVIHTYINQFLHKRLTQELYRTVLST